jgi:hypothetical protein
MTHHLEKGLLTKTWVVKGTWFIMLRGKLWVESSSLKLSVLLSNLGTLQGPSIFGGGPDDYLYYCLDNMETKVCYYMADNIGFPKIESMLSTMSSENFSDYLAYKHLMVISIDFFF